MALHPHCDKCNVELTAFSGIILGPPNDQEMVRKWHLCADCYKEISEKFKTT